MTNWQNVPTLHARPHSVGMKSIELQEDTHSVMWFYKSSSKGHTESERELQMKPINHAYSASFVKSELFN